MVKITQNINEATVVTHGGVFHCDDVMATVILSKVLGEVTVCRTFRVPDNLKKEVIVYDIGFGRFDHHQKGGNGARVNGVPFAACGLIWNEFGRLLVKETCNPDFIWKRVDRDLIQGIDAIDTGAMPCVDYPAHAMTLSGSVWGFNPAWDSTETPDEAFLKAVDFAEKVFDNVFNNAVSKAKAQEIVERAIDNSDGHIMVMECFAPWQEYVLASCNEKAKEIQFVVFPSNREGYNWQCVPAGFGTREVRKTVPVEWRGLRDEELQRVSGVSSAIFCHQAGFIGSAAILEDAITMARIAASS